jgi:hypothetical protein
VSKQRGASEFTVILLMMVLIAAAAYYFGYKNGKKFVNMPSPAVQDQTTSPSVIPTK